MCKLFTPLEICSSAWGLWKVLCLDGTYIRPFSSSCEEKEDLCTSLFFWLLPLPIPSFHCSGVGTAGASRRIQNSSHSSTFSLFIPTGFFYLFVVASFAFTLRNIHVFVYRYAVEQGYLTFSTYAIRILFNPFIFSFH